MASESEASCDEDPNFAVICAFFEKFGELLGVTDIDFCELQTMLENTYEVPKFLMDLHVKLLRKIKKSVHPERWERSIIKFGHTFSSKDAWEVERFGYKNAKLTSKVRILKELLEAQFDLNTKFKTEINKLGSSELRSQPLGRDKFGHAYWFQSDDNYQIRVFKEDLDDEKWTLVARDRTGLVSLINILSDGDIKISSDSAGNEDSNSLSEKPIIDTGQQDTDSKKTSDDEDSNLERKHEDKDDEKSKPTVRIKNLRDLLPSPKRPREEEDEGTVFQKYKIKNLEIRVSKIEKEEPVVGEAIEEPVMTIQGEGSGEDNESPIVGETIEEDIMYVYGNGNGHDCQTGNQPEEKKEESAEMSSEMKSTEENIPKQGTDDSASKINESSQSKDSESRNKFFFGSGSSLFKSNSLSSTVAFGSSKMDKGSDENHVIDEDISTSEKSNVDNKTVNINETKASEKVPAETEANSKNNEISELLEPKEKLQGSKKETDNVDKSLKGSNDTKNNVEYNDSECKRSEITVMEPLCVKKFAYVCGKDQDDERDTSVKKLDSVSIATDETIKNAGTINTNKTVNDNDAVKTHESVVTTESVKTADTTETDETTETLITAEIVKTTKPSKTDKGNLKPSGKTIENSQETDLKKNGGENSLDSNDFRTDQDPQSNLASVDTDHVEKSETKTVSDLCIPDTKQNSDSVDKESEVQPEVVFVSGRTRGKKQGVTVEGSEKPARPIKKIGKSGTGMKKKNPKSLDREKAEEKTKVNSAESSMPDSPSLSLGDNSVISMTEMTAGDSCDLDVPAADPLAVSDAEGEPKSAVTGPTISSFSLDFNEPPKPKKIPLVPSPMRAVRKRGREVTSLKTTEVDNGPGKRMKLKGRRQVDTALRKSVEQRIEQLQGSSSESKDSEAEQHPKTKKKTSRLKKSATKKGRKKNASPEDTDAKPKKSSQIKRDPAKKNSRILAGLDINDDSSNDRPVLRQSRRLAQLKIKEQVDPVVRSIVKEEVKNKKSKNGNKIDKPEKRKRDKKGKETEFSEPEAIIETKKKKKKEKPVNKIFNENRPWQSSSEDSEEVAEEEEEEEEIIEEDYVVVADLKSDHEFSPESDLEDDDYQPMKRARTAKKESDEEEAEEFPCQKCGKEDHPEWILLCDKCDSGWHCSCLRPPLLVIPEGDWFCPPCQHIILLEQLQARLVEYDKKLSKKEVEDRRKERLAYVGISLNNVLPSKEHVDHRKKKRRHSASGSNSSSSETEASDSESESDSDEPIYQLRQRRQTKNYKFNEYDEMMKTAIGEDANKPEDTAGNLGRGKDIQTIVKGLEPEPEVRKGEEGHDRPSVTNLKKMLRKKHRKLNSLEFDSEEEDISDEDFKGSSNQSEEEDDEEPDETEDSDDYMGRKRRKNLPVRRSTRPRTRRYDTDFVTDDSEDEPPKRKKKKSIWDDSDTEDSDGSGYGPKERKKKKKKKKRKDHSDDELTVKKNRPRIKYGGLTTSEEEEFGKGRRTRGKKTTYVDTLGSDSEEEAETKKNPRRIVSDDEDFVANEEDEVDEEKDSDDKEEPVEDEGDADSEQERREKRSLLVPKIYIKKPLGEKKQRELEAAKIKATVNIENETTAIKKPEELVREESKDMKIDEKESEPNKDEKQIQIIEATKPVDEPSDELHKNELKVVEGLTKDTEFPIKEVIEENAIKKEAVNLEEKSENTTEPMKPNTGIPIFQSSVSLVKVPGKRGRKPKVVHEPIISNVTSLFKNDDENDDLSEPPGISLTLFDDLASNSANSKESSASETPKKRRGRGPGKKKTLEESLSSIGTKITPLKVPQPAIEIAAPPQPFSQAQPTPSVITRMLQAKPGITIYPVGRIRPKQFATMRDDDSDESSPRNSPSSSPAAASPMSGPLNQYNIPGGPRVPPPMVGPYRSHGPPHPGMNHYPRGPPGFRGPPPSQGMLPHPYSHHPSHRPMDPSPSGGGPINLTDPGPGPPAGGPMAGPGRDSPGRRGPPISRYPSVGQTSPGPILTTPRPQLQLPPQQSFPPPPASSNGPPVSQQVYHPPPTSTNTATQQQSYPPRPTSNNNPPPPQQLYHQSSNSSSGPPPPQQSYPPPSSSSNGPPPQQPYHPRPTVSNGPPSQQTYPTPPTANNGPPAQLPFPPRPSSNNGSAPQQSYSPRPTSSNNGPPPSQPPEGYYGNYPPPVVEEPTPPTTYQGMPPGASSPYPEQYSADDQPPAVPPSDTSNPKAYDDESGGEFAGLASYFSSQRDDDCES